MKDVSVKGNLCYIDILGDIKVMQKSVKRGKV